MASVSGTPSNSYANSSKSFLNAYLDACIFQRNVCWRNDFDSGAASIKRGANRKAPSHRHSWLGVSRRRRPALVVKGCIMPNTKQPLKPDDFPVNAEDKKIKKQDGTPVADTDDPAVAAEIAERLNEDEAQREEDKWSA
jgi:hypothetical protein